MSAPPPVAQARPLDHAGVVVNPGGDIAIGKPVIAEPAYPDQKAPPKVLFGPPTAQGARVQSTPTASTYYYAHPQGFQPSPYAAAMATATPIASGSSAAPVAMAVPITQGQAVQMGVRPEVTARFTNGSLTSTGPAVAAYGGDPVAVTHANFFWNDIAAIEGLERFPNLIRLTLRGNHLVNLLGVSTCPHLRWLDVSTNDLRDFSGAGAVASLEWLDAHDNNLRTLDGLGFAPNLTWLNMCNSDLNSLAGLRNTPALRVLDVSKNELTTTAGVGHCPRLIEVNLHMNNLESLDEVDALRELRALDLSSNELSSLRVLNVSPTLHTLLLSHNNLGSRNVGEIVDSLGNHPALRVLKIGRNAFTGDDVTRLRGAVSAQVDNSGEAGPCGTCLVA